MKDLKETSISMPRIAYIFTGTLCLLISGLQSVILEGSVIEDIRIVAVTGQPAASSQGVFDEVRPAVINDSGEVAFLSRLTGIPGVPEITEGLFVETNGNLEFITRTGLTVPGSTRLIQTLTRPQIDDAGKVLVRGNFNDPSGQISMMLSNTGGSLRTVAAQGDPLTELGNGARFDSNFREPVLSRAGVIAFAAELVDDTNTGECRRGGPCVPSLGMSIWTDNGVDLELLVREGDAATMTEPGTTIGRLDGDEIVINEVGQVAYFTSLTGPSITIENFSAFYVSDGTTDRLVARRGDVAPGFALTDRLSLTDVFLTINGVGEVAFTSRIDGEGGFSTAGIFAESNGHLRLVAAIGSELPDLPDGVTFGANQNIPIMNDRGDVAFRASLSGTGVSSSNNQSLWSEGLGGMHLVGREGDHATGALPGVLFRDFFEPFLNSLGQTAFMGKLTGPGVDSSNDTALWTENSTGELQMIAQEGDMIEVAPGDFRTIEYLLLPDNIFYGSGNNDGLRSPFNNRGELVFEALFDDGTSGIFVSSAVAVPEPTSAALALAVAFFFVLCEHRPTKLGGIDRN